MIATKCILKWCFVEHLIPILRDTQLFLHVILHKTLQDKSIDIANGIHTLSINKDGVCQS